MTRKMVLRIISDEYAREMRLSLVEALQAILQDVQDEGYVPLRGADEGEILAVLEPRIFGADGLLRGSTLFLSLTGNRFCMYANKFPEVICVADGPMALDEAEELAANMVEVSMDRDLSEMVRIAVRFTS